MSGQKPTFVFFKMLNCGHCTQFAENPTPEKSPWAELLRDPELQAAVNFVRYDWGVEKKASGEMVQHKLPEEYKFVNYGPYFYMHDANNVNNGLEFKQGQDGPRTPAGMKKWILDTLRKDPQLSKARRVQATPLPAPVNAPKPEVAPRNQRPGMLAPNQHVQSLVQGKQHPTQRITPPSPPQQVQVPQPMPQQQMVPQVPQQVQQQRGSGQAVKVVSKPPVRANIIARNRRR